MKTIPTEYIPGVCNINPREIAYRKKAYIVAALISIALVFAHILLDSNAVFGIVLFLPIFVAVLNYLQVRNRFCVNYASHKGMHNASDDDTPVTIIESEQIELDKKKARKMNVQAAGAAAIITLLVVLV